MSSSQSLFIKCQQCQQRPATIKCSQCRYGQIFRLCYSCDSSVHNRLGPIDLQHKTEIIPYQEMYSKAGNQPQAKQSYKPEPVKPVQPTKEPKQPYKSVRNEKDSNYSSYRKEPTFSPLNNSQHSRGNKNRYDSNQEPEEPPKSQTKREEINPTVKNDIRVLTEKLQSEFTEQQTQTQRSTTEMQRKLSDIKKAETQQKQQVTQLQNELKTLKTQLSSLQKKQDDELRKNFKERENKLNELAAVLQQKDEQLQAYQQEFQSYDLESIQQKINEIQEEANMKEQVIAQLQRQLEKKKPAAPAKKGGKQQGGGDKHELDNILRQIDQKDTDLEKLQGIVENFKILYEKMNDEKQVLVEENEKLGNENNQFRELFQQNLHLFGIDPEQLNQEGEDGEIIEENEQETNDTS